MGVLVPAVKLQPSVPIAWATIMSVILLVVMRKGIQGANQRVCLGAKAEGDARRCKTKFEILGGVKYFGKGKGTAPPTVGQDDYDAALKLSSRAS